MLGVSSVSLSVVFLSSANTLVRIALRTLLLFFMLQAVAQSQVIEERHLKAAFLFNFFKHTTWPDEAVKDAFTLTIYNDSAFYDAIAPLMNGKLIRGKPLQVLSSSSLKNLGRAEMVYVSRRLNANLPQIAVALRRSETLLVTESSIEKQDVMINFLTNDETNSISFEINKSNIIYENLEISGELLLLGGTELDVAVLYRETQLAMQKIKEQSIGLEKQTRALLVRLDNASLELKTSTQQLNKDNHELRQKESSLAQLQKNIEKQRQTFSDKEKELLTLTAQQIQRVEESQKILQQKQQEISDKSNEVAAMEQTIAENQAKLADQVQRLEDSQQQIQTKDEKIKSQDTYLLITSSFVIIISIFTLLVILLFWRNKKTTLKLQDTLARLENAQKQLVESKKMASLGMLTAGVAHEINTPLGAMVTSISIVGDTVTALEGSLEKSKLSKRAVMESLAQIRDAAKISESSLSRMTLLISNFKELAVEHAIEDAYEVNLGSYIKTVISSVAERLKKRDIRYDFSDCDNIKMVTQLNAVNQILTNLFNNAMLHAFDDQQEKVITLTLRKSATNGAVITFTDNGVGMDKQTLQNIYEPFFTTKRNQGGTGLGMNIVYNIVVQKLKGSIDIKSKPGQGTQFVISIPASKSTV